jgi:hypothetical protein
MAIVFDGPVSPDALTEYVRNVPTPVNQILNQVLPDRHFTKNKIDVSVLTRRGRTARFRAFDANVHKTSRDTAVINTVKLPPLSDSISMGELESLELELARNEGSNMQSLIEQMYDDAGNLTRNIQRRMELARGDVLTDGKFTLAGEGGLTLEADYGVPAPTSPRRPPSGPTRSTPSRSTTCSTGCTPTTSPPATGSTPPAWASAGRS